VVVRAFAAPRIAAMVSIRREAELPASPEHVWEVATPPAGWPAWLSLHVRWPQEPPADLAVGSRFQQVVSLLGLPIPVAWTITDLEAPHVFAMAGEAIAGVKITIRFDISPAPTGADLVVSAELSGALVAGSLKSTVQKYADTQVSASVQALAALLGSETA
jgi:hypothetical protein